MPDRKPKSDRMCDSVSDVHCVRTDRCCKLLRTDVLFFDVCLVFDCFFFVLSADISNERRKKPTQLNSVSLIAHAQNKFVLLHEMDQSQSNIAAAELDGRLDRGGVGGAAVVFVGFAVGDVRLREEDGRRGLVSGDRAKMPDSEIRGEVNRLMFILPSLLLSLMV